MGSLARTWPWRIARTSGSLSAASKILLRSTHRPAAFGGHRLLHANVLESRSNGYSRTAQLNSVSAASPLAGFENLSDNGPAIAKAENKALAVHRNGKLYHFHPVFLRDQCNCELCVDPYSGQKNFETADIPLNIEINETAVDPTDNSVKISWRNDVPEYSPDHCTRVPEQLFETWCAHSKSTAPETRFSTWDGQTIRRNLKFIDYEAYMNDSLQFAEAVKSLQDWGLVFLNKVPKNEQSVELIGEKFGLLRNTFYGHTWDVRDVVEAQNVAYTTKQICLHMDLLYMRQPPGFQLLHCISSSTDGGVSMFADSYHAARIISEQSPTAFDDLCKFPVTYSYQKGGNSFEDTKPVFEVGPYTRESPEIPRHQYLRAINWSPPFQGPMKFNTGVEDRGHTLENWLRAAKLFKDLISADENTFLHKLEPGQCVIFHNRRVLHGRTAFSSSSRDAKARSASGPTEPRWLKGAYLDAQDFESTYRKIVAQTTVT